MSALDDAAELASHLKDLVSPSSYEMPWNKFPRGIMDPAYILSGIGPAFQEASRVYQTLDLPEPDPTKVASAWEVFAEETTRIKGELASAKMGLLSSVPIIGPLVAVPMALAYKIQSSVYGGLVTALYYTSVVGAFGHLALKDASTQQFSIHKMVIDGDLPEQTAVAHAGWCYTGFKLITMLDQFKLLAPLKKGGTSGLGAFPLVPVLIAALVGIAIIAGAIVISKNLSEVNRLQAKVVEKKLEVMVETCRGATDRKIVEMCAHGPTADDLRGGSLAAGISDALAKTGQSLAKYLVIAGALYVGFALLSTKATKKAAQTVAA